MECWHANAKHGVGKAEVIACQQSKSGPKRMLQWRTRTLSLNLGPRTHFQEACLEPREVRASSREVRAGSREVRAHAVRSASPVVWVRCAEAAHPASPTPARPSAPPTHARHLRTDASYLCFFF